MSDLQEWNGTVTVDFNEGQSETVLLFLNEADWLPHR